MIDRVENLKRMTGGYNLSLMKSSKEELKTAEFLAEKVARIFKIKSDQLRIVQDSPQKITFDVTSESEVGGKFKKLQELVTQQDIKDFTLTRKSLEDLFLLLSQN